MNLTPIGLEGLKRAGEKLEKTAQDLSRLPAPAGLGELDGTAAAAADEVDLSASMMALLEARHTYEANLKLIETGNEINGHAIDLIG